jgi:hypothetical protein
MAAKKYNKTRMAPPSLHDMGSRNAYSEEDKKILQQEILADLKRLNKELGRTPLIKEIKQHSKYSFYLYNSLFGNVYNALTKAGINADNIPGHISEEQLLDEIKRLHRELGRAPKIREINQLGKYSFNSYVSKFGTLSKLLEKAGIRDLSKIKNVTRELLVEDLKRIGKELGRTPKTTDLKQFSEYSSGAFNLHFDSFKEALALAGFIKG